MSERLDLVRSTYNRNEGFMGRMGEHTVTIKLQDWDIPDAERADLSVLPYLKLALIDEYLERSDIGRRP